jgi:tetratricopeptide (TPR) repeat protein
LAVSGQLAGAFARLDACEGNPELVALCRQCLSPEREGRPRDASELAAALADLRVAAEERARTADLDRVRAEAETRELRARRKVVIAVAASVALLLTSGGVFAWWHDHVNARHREADLKSQLKSQIEDADRRDRLRRNGDAVATLLTTTEEAVRANDAYAARLALEQAEARVTEGGAEHLTGRRARCRADLELLLDLNRIEEQRWALVGGRNPGGRPAAAELPAAFERYGIVPGTTPEAVALDRIRNSLVRDRLLTALDWWLDWSRSPAVLALLRAADPDDFRSAVRAAVAADALSEVDRLAAQPEALAQPAWFALVLGDALAVPPSRRRELVLSALKKRAGDHQLLLTVGYLEMIYDPANTAEYEKWFRAAVAVKPGSPIAHNYVGVALRNRNLMAEAAAEFEAAIALDPDYAGANNNLAWVLATARDPRQRDGRRAVELATRACEGSKWTIGTFIDTLAAAHAEVGEFDKAVEYAGCAVAAGDIEPSVRAGAAGRLELFKQRKPYRMPEQFAGHPH